MWGGATFDFMMQFLDEAPWKRVEMLKEAMPKAEFRMLLIGSNILAFP